MPKRLAILDVIACPLCKGKLIYDRSRQELICKFDKLAYQLDKGIPIMLKQKSRKITANELAKTKKGKAL